MTKTTTEMSSRLWLTEELDRRKRKNPQYSLRSFAQALGLSAATLSQVLSGKRPLTVKAAHKIAARCEMEPRLRREFLAGTALNGVEERQPSQDYEQLEIDGFHVISDWWHYAILSLGEIPESRASADWLAKRLGIPKKTASDAFERLKRLGLIEVKSGRYRQVGKRLTTSRDVADAAVRKFHRQTLEKAAAALDTVAVEKRDFGAVTLAVAESDLPRAKDLLRSMRRSFTDDIGANAKRERVYTLAIQFFPVDREDS